MSTRHRAPLLQSNNEVSMRVIHVILFALVSAIASCAAPTAEPPPTASQHQELALEPFAAVSFPQGFGIHGIDATSSLWFAAVAYPPSVHVARRVTGQVLGELPPPPTPLPGGGTGFGAVVAVRVAPDGRVVVLDGVVAPTAAGSAPAMLYEYQVQPTWSGFTATLVKSTALPLIPFSEIPVAAAGAEPRPPISGIFFPIMMSIFPGGEAALTDTVTGAVWVSDPSRSTFRNALQDPRLRPLPQLGPDGQIAPIFGKGRAPGGGTRDYTLILTSPPGAPPMLPGAFGVAYLAATNEVVLANPSQGMLAISYASFMAPTNPTLKSAGVRPLAPALFGTTDLVAGLDTNRWDCDDPWVYFQRVAADSASGFKNVMSRVNGITGAVETLARSSTVFDFDVAVAVVQPLLPIKHVVTIGSGVGQEENNPFVNATLAGVPSFVSPTPIGAVIATY
jgi:hypothetical protein